MRDVKALVHGALGCVPASVSPLGSGAGGSTWRVALPEGRLVVAKIASQSQAAALDVEARMLRVLREESDLPVPEVIHAQADLLILEHCAGHSSFDADAERHAANLLSSLHAVSSPDGRYGLEFDGLIGPLPQSNTPSDSWVEFWRHQRLGAMAQEAMRERRLPAALGARLDRLGARLGEMLPDRPRPSLIHGDVWAGNVLAENGRVTAFLDPAVYYAHSEVELAFISMFSTFSDAFFEQHQAINGPMEPEFWSRRLEIYQMYPLLVHVRLYGGSFVASLDHTLGMLGF